MTQGPLMFKAVSGTLDVDEAEGIVECFVAAIGNKDSVGDIVMPGAFSNSLKRRAPRVVWGHDWNQPIGKVLSIYEVQPGDPRLPGKMRSAGVGGLFAKVQFNLKSERGREAFASVAFFGQDQEWSIGYKTVDAVYDNSKQANLLKEVELYEVSPVLHGANQLTGTISVKADEALSTANSATGGGADMARALASDVGSPVHIMFLSDDTVVYGVTQGEDTQTFEANYKRTESGFTFSDAKPVKFVVNGSATPAPGKMQEQEMEEDDDKKPSGEGNSDTAQMFQMLHGLIAELEKRTSPGEHDEYVDAEGKPHIKVETPPLNPANLAPDVLPQERVTGDVLRGYGPRRGNLERLLRYWRPIMRKEGGFRRCLVILADHPELYPLENLCAWLHHETTGLWPNEGCHHPGMKNCRRKLKRVIRGSLWNDREFDRHIAGMDIPSARRLNAMPGKALPQVRMMDVDGDGDAEVVLTFDDMRHAFVVLKEFMDAEPEFMSYLGDENNWEHEGDFEDEVGGIKPMMHPRVMPQASGGCGCGGGCGGMGKSDCGCDEKHDSDFLLMAKNAAAVADLEYKAGRTLSGKNMQRLQQAASLIQEVLNTSQVQVKDAQDDDQYLIVDVNPENLFAVKELLDPIAEYYDADVVVDEDDGEFLMVAVKSVDQYDAMTTALNLSEFRELSTKSLLGQAAVAQDLQVKSLAEVEETASRLGEVLDAGFSEQYNLFLVDIRDEAGQSWQTLWTADGRFDGMFPGEANEIV